jgi:glycosyltransferase involved in cell wall biosynthesis
LAGKTGWLAQPILDEISRLPPSIAERIRLPGFIADADKAALISGATALLYPSLYEGFGFPVLEAQACGTAVLCANSSSLPEVAADAALLVDPMDTAALTAAIQRISTDSDLRQKLVLKGLSNVERFTWQKAATQVLTILEEVASL